MPIQELFSSSHSREGGITLGIFIVQFLFLGVLLGIKWKFKFIMMVSTPINGCVWSL